MKAIKTTTLIFVLALHALIPAANAQQEANVQVRPASNSELSLLRMQLGASVKDSAAILFRDVAVRVTTGKKRDDLWNVCGYLNKWDSNGDYVGYRGFYLSAIYDRLAQNVVVITGPEIHDPEAGGVFSVPIFYCKKYGMPLK